MTTDRRLDVYLAQRGVRQHRYAAGTAGVPGECAAECSCGTYFAGFDTLAEADALLGQHIERANLARLTPRQRRRVTKKASRDAVRVVLAGAA